MVLRSLVIQVFAGLSLGGALGDAFAQGDYPPIAELPALAVAAKSDYRPITEAKVAESKAELQRAMEQLQPQLDLQPRLREHLQWEALVKELAEKQPNLAALNSVLNTFAADEEGLEQEDFTKVRIALVQYMSLYRYQRSPQTQALVEQQLDLLAGHLKHFAEQPSNAEAVSIGRIVGFLESADQAERLVQAVRFHYWRPNLYAKVSERVASTGLARSVDETQNVNENILGTSIQGVARLIARTHVDLLPSADRAALRIVLSGAANSNNVGFNRGVTIHSNGLTSVSAEKQVFLTPDGLSHAGATANASTSTTIQSICARCQIVRKIAQRKVYQLKSQAQQIASQRTAQRIADAFEGTSLTALGETNSRYLEKFRNPLLRKGEFPRLLALSSTEENLLLRLLQVNDYELGGYGQPPEESSGLDLSVQLHQSMVGNMSQALVGGVELTDEKLAQLIKDLGGEVPEELQIKQDEDPWSITFANSQPFQVTFNDDQSIRISIHGRRFTRGDARVNEEMTIAAEYEMQKTPEGALLKRRGDVQAAYDGGGFERPEKIAIKTVMRRKFGALFKPELKSEGIALPGREDGSAKLKLQVMQAKGPWMALGWLLDDGAVLTAEQSPNSQAPILSVAVDEANAGGPSR